MHWLEPPPAIGAKPQSLSQPSALGRQCAASRHSETRLPSNSLLSFFPLPHFPRQKNPWSLLNLKKVRPEQGRKKLVFKSVSSVTKMTTDPCWSCTRPTPPHTQRKATTLSKPCTPVATWKLQTRTLIMKTDFSQSRGCKRLLGEALSRSLDPHLNVLCIGH